MTAPANPNDPPSRAERMNAAHDAQAAALSAWEAKHDPRIRARDRAQRRRNVLEWLGGLGVVLGVALLLPALDPADLDVLAPLGILTCLALLGVLCALALGPRYEPPPEPPYVWDEAAWWESQGMEPPAEGGEPPPDWDWNVTPEEHEARRLAWIATLPAERQRQIAEAERRAAEQWRNRAQLLTPAAPDTRPWTDLRPLGTPNTETAMIDRENRTIMTPAQWRARQT